MQDGYCTKHFPKPFNTETLWDSNQACPTYRRRSPQDNGRSFEHNGRIVDNSWVVPYSPYLCLRYEAHINVEICASALAAKYLFKYVYKGPDCAKMQIKVDIAGSGQKVSSSSSARDAPDIDTDVALQVRNEISEYQDMRSIGSSKTCWRIFGFHMRSRKPSVIGLQVYLSDQQMVYFQESDVRQKVATPARKTQLTAFFDYNLHNPGTNVRYCDFPKHFTYKNKTDGVYWCVRQRMFDTIGRVHTVLPLAGDVFNLQILLNTDHSRGKTLFEHLRTVNDQLQTSYQETCQILGLLQDDGEWDMVLHDASTLQLCAQIRELFTVLLLNCHPANPLELFNTHCHEWLDDFAKLMPDPQDKILLRAMVLLDLESRLRMAGKELLDFSLPDVSADVRSQVDQVNGLIQVRHLPVVVQEELTYDR